MIDSTDSAQRGTRTAERHAGRPVPLLVVFNCVRISLCAAWTAIVGVLT